MTKPHLFGLTNSNRDFSLKDTWGKNQFNSSFPIALCCYLASKKLNANYLKTNKNKLDIGTIEIKDIFGIQADNSEIFFAFETSHSPFAKYVIGSLPRTDIVIQNSKTGICLTGLEIKLTALPDHTTCNSCDEFFGSEIVIRPDSIVYLACSLADILGNNLNKHIIYSSKIEKINWSEPKQIIPFFEDIKQSLDNICQYSDSIQKPFLLQPVWKTLRKSSRLANNCLDVFVWSDVAFVKFILSIANLTTDCSSINRPTRTSIWLYKMLLEIVLFGKFNHQQIIDSCSYNTKNDKAFASSGLITNPFMRCERLKDPIISKSEIKNIILGGGQDLLSPERRFDAIIYNSPELFL